MIVDSLRPRSLLAPASAIADTFAVMLAKHPDAFDCLVYRAKSAAHDEILSAAAPVIGLLDSDERAQEYEPPAAARAMIAPNQEFSLEASDDGLNESFDSAKEPLTMILSEAGLPRFSLVQWREWAALEGGRLVDRVVYVAGIRSMGRTPGAGMIYTCRPLPALGELPEEFQGEGAGNENGGAENGGDDSDGGGNAGNGGGGTGAAENDAPQAVGEL